MTYSKRQYVVCRAKFLLPLSEPDRTLRIEDGYVLADGENIIEVGKYTDTIGTRLLTTFGNELHIMGDPLTGDDIPCINGVLLPAFVKAHGHDHEQPLIGIAKDEPLTSWLDHAVNPFTRFLRVRKKELSELLGCAPQLAVYRMARLADIHYGITASMVHHCNFNKYHLSEIAEANETAGTTMMVAVGGQDRHYTKEVLDQPGEAVERLKHAAVLKGLKHTSFCPGPDQLFSNSRQQLIPLKQWAREHDTLFHTHSAEEPNTTRWFTEEIEPGMTPVEYADSIGILDENTVLAHQVNCGPNDLEILARTGTKIVHNPLANTILGSGMPPIMEMIAAGIAVAISTDGSGSSDNQNILAAARLAAQYQKAFHQDATVLPSEQLMEMITVIPSKILRLNRGELAPGRQADWVVLDLDRPNLAPTRLDNLTENLIWAADGSEINRVVARGRILKDDGRIAPFSDGTTPEQIMKAVQVLSERFIVHLETSDELSGTGAHQ